MYVCMYTEFIRQTLILSQNIMLISQNVNLKQWKFRVGMITKSTTSEREFGIILGWVKESKHSVWFRVKSPVAVLLEIF